MRDVGNRPPQRVHGRQALLRSLLGLQVRVIRHGQNVRAIGRGVAQSRRRDTVEFSHRAVTPEDRHWAARLADALGALAAVPIGAESARAIDEARILA